MTHERALLRSAPYFPVADVERAVLHYERVFGFAREYVAGPEFGIVSRDGLPVMFRRVADPALINPNERQGGSWDAFFWVGDAKALHAELSGRGAEVVYGPLVQESYNMLEFAVRDHAGYVLGFGQSLPGREKSAS
jgi:hypothetical protein